MRNVSWSASRLLREVAVRGVVGSLLWGSQSHAHVDPDAAPSDSTPAEDGAVSTDGPPKESSAPEEDDPQPRATTETDGPARAVTEFRVTGIEAWGLERVDLRLMPVSLTLTPTGYVGAGEAEVESRPLGEWIAESPDAAFHESALELLVRQERFREWLLSEYSVDYGDQTIGPFEFDDGVATLELEPPGPGEIDRSADPIRVTEVRLLTFDGEPFEAVESGQGLTREEVLDVTAVLTPFGNEYVGFRQGLDSETVRLGDLPARSEEGDRFYDSAIRTFSVAIADAYFDKGFRGIQVGQFAEDFLEAADEDVLVLRINQAPVGEVRSIIRRRKQDAETNPPRGARFTRDSPVQPGDLIDQRAIDRYVGFLNRHPGRRVDVAVAPAAEEGEVSLDYIIQEEKPLLLYAQLSNTGTDETTILRERFGLTHFNLTNRDDILTLDYITGNFEEVHAVLGSYTTPLGSKRFRTRVFGSYVEYDASEVGLAGADFQGESATGGGEFAWNVWQDRRSNFIDLTGGIRFEHIRVESEDAGIGESKDFLLPYVGIRYDSIREYSRSTAGAQIEWNVAEVTDQTDLDELGRLDSSDDWTAIRWDVSTSFFLEELLISDKLAQGKGSVAHEVYLAGRGFHVLGDRRLPPNFTDTVGGFYSVRGYPEAFVLGDQVLNGTVEYRWHVPRSAEPSEAPGRLFGREFRWRPSRPLARPDWDFLIRGFLDVGQVYNNDKADFENNETLLGAGIGAELSIRNNLIARVDWGIALLEASNGSDDIVQEGDSVVHFSLTLVF